MKKVFPITSKCNQEYPGHINRSVIIHKSDGEAITLRKTFNNLSFKNKVRKDFNAR